VRRWYEEVWEEVPAELEPPLFAVRRDFLLGEVEPGDRVLDLGCGDGRFAEALVRAGAQVTGADVAEAALVRARRRAPDVEYVRIEPHGSWPFSDQAFDVVWAGEVLEHVADTEAWLREVRRVLAPGGRFLATTPHVGPLRRLAAPPDPRGQHLRFYTRRTLRAVLSDMGFADVSARWRRGTVFARARR
jgi:ubiquinone/menaquinone biosynthesis C-methylase UbiE